MRLVSGNGKSITQQIRSGFDFTSWKNSCASGFDERNFYMKIDGFCSFYIASTLNLLETNQSFLKMTNFHFVLIESAVFQKP